MSDQTSPAAEAMPSAVGRYQITGTLGFGAMGAVYKAFDPLIKRTLAIKTIRLDVPRQSPQYASFIERFYREARVSGTLSHPNIVTLFDIGEEAGVPFLAMEYVDGRTIAAVIEEGTRFKPEKVISLVSQVATAIDYAHSRGVVHRDIKPSNLIVYEEDKVKVTDFGIAKLADSEITHAGVLLGTPSYMSPEQAMGEKLDGRSDIFSLGVCAFEMLSGLQPFPGANVTAILYKLVHVDPIEPADLETNGLVPEKWREVFHKVLAKKPADRYQTASAFVQDLEYCLGSWFTGLGAETLPPSDALLASEPTLTMGAPPRGAALEPTARLEPAARVSAEPSGPSASPAAPDDEATIPIRGAAGGASAPEPPTVSLKPASASDEVTVVLPEAPATTVTLPEVPTLVAPPRGAAPAAAKPAAATAGPGRAGRRSPLGLLLAGAAVVVLGVGITGLLLWQRGRASAKAPEAGATGAPPSEVASPGPSAAATIAPGSIRIETSPTGARVLVDGAARGQTPLELSELPLGSYDLRLELNGYEPQARTVLLSAEQPVARLGIELVRSAVAVGAADIVSTPSGATVTVDGRAAGRTPLSGVSLKPGSHRLQLALAGHEAWAGTIDVVAGQKGRVEVRLRPSAEPTPPPATEKEHLARVYGPNEVDVQPRKRSGDSPSYPSDRGARRLRSGERVSVVLEFTVTETGEVRDLKVVESAGALIDDVVMAAVRGWKFQPATRHGTPVKSRTGFKQTFLGG